MLYRTLLIALAICFITCSSDKESKAAIGPKASATPSEKLTASEIKAKRINGFAANLKPYVLKNGYNQSVCFLIDMKKASGENRFYVYDFKKNKIIREGLVTHGNCGKLFLPKPEYGNTVGCNCSSLGKYRIGKKYYGRFGLAYKLHGLDKTNDKAFERYVVLHAHSCVPDKEVEPFGICASNGCPTVSTNFLQTLSSYIDQSKKPLLLWMFE